MNWASGISQKPTRERRMGRGIGDAQGRVFRSLRGLSAQSTVRKQQLRIKACHLPGAPPTLQAAGSSLSDSGPPAPISWPPQSCSSPGSWHINHGHLKPPGPQAVANGPPHLVFLSGAGVPGRSNHPGEPRAGGFRECQDHQEQQLLSLRKWER